MNFFNGRMLETAPDSFVVELEGQARIQRRGSFAAAPGQPVVFGIRPEQLRVSLLEPKDFENGLFGQIERHVFAGDATFLKIRLENGSVADVRVPNYLMAENRVLALEHDERVWVVWSQGSGIVLHA